MGRACNLLVSCGDRLVLPRLVILGGPTWSVVQRDAMMADALCGRHGRCQQRLNDSFSLLLCSFASFEEMAAAAASPAPRPSDLLARLQQAAAALASGSGDSSSGGGKLRPWDGWGLPGRGGQQSSGSSSAGKMPGELSGVKCDDSTCRLLLHCTCCLACSLHGHSHSPNTPSVSPASRCIPLASRPAVGGVC